MADRQQVKKNKETAAALTTAALKNVEREARLSSLVLARTVAAATAFCLWLPGLALRAVEAEGPRRRWRLRDAF